MKITLTITDKHILLPLDLMGAPQMDESWIARADLEIQGEEFIVKLYKKKFKFEKTTQIYAAESVAKSSFKDGNYEVKRVFKYKISPHIPAKNFIQSNPIPTGDFEFYVSSGSFVNFLNDEPIVLSLDLSPFPKDQDNIRLVKNLLVR